MADITKTYMAKPHSVERKWILIDAEGKRLGKVVVEAARVLMGKDKPEYTPGVDTGDFVIVVNAGKVEVSGNKATQKMYYRHSGYPQGLKSTPFFQMLERRPEYVIEKAVRGMLPKNRLGRSLFRKLHVYAGPDHPHEAQQPVVHEF